MTEKKMVSACAKLDSDFVFLRMDTLIERLKRMRAMNTSPCDIGITQYAWRTCGVRMHKKDR